MYQYFIKVVPTMYNKLSGEVWKLNVVYHMTHVNSQHVHVHISELSCSVLSKDSRTLTRITLLLKFTLLTLDMDFPLLHNTHTHQCTHQGTHFATHMYIVCIQMLVHTCLHAHRHTHTHTRLYTQVHACIRTHYSGYVTLQNARDARSSERQ